MVIEYFLDWVQTAPVRKREAAASAMARTYLNKTLTTDDREDLEAAITILLEDNAPTVRLALAETFGAFGSAPRHIMSALARDSAEIAMSVLSCSPVFHDSELVAFIKRGDEDSQIAISCRPWLSPAVVTAICEHGCRDATFGLLMNPVAEYQSTDFNAIAERYGSDAEIRNALLEVENLPVVTRHILIGKLRNALGNFVRQKSWMSEDRLSNTLIEAGERASIIFAANAPEQDIPAIIRQLIQEDRLTVEFLVRAMCMGNITFLACALSELSGVKFAKVEAILGADREAAFRAVYDRAGLPGSAFAVFRVGVTTWRRLLSSGSKINQARLPFLVTRDVLAGCAAGHAFVPDELLVLLRRLAADAARENSRSKAREIAQRSKSVETPQIADASDAEVLSEIPAERSTMIEQEPLASSAAGMEILDLGQYVAQSLDGEHAEAPQEIAA